MNEIIMKTYELIDVIDDSDIIRNLEVYKNRILNNHELCELIKKANSSNDDYLIMDIKKKLYKNDDYKGYMDNYNKLFYIVMSINKKYKSYIKDKGCFR